MIKAQHSLATFSFWLIQMLFCLFYEQFLLRHTIKHRKLSQNKIFLYFLGYQSDESDPILRLTGGLKRSNDTSAFLKSSDIFN